MQKSFSESGKISHEGGIYTAQRGLARLEKESANENAECGSMDHRLASPVELTHMYYRQWHN